MISVSPPPSPTPFVLGATRLLCPFTLPGSCTTPFSPRSPVLTWCSPVPTPVCGWESLPGGGRVKKCGKGNTGRHCPSSLSLVPSRGDAVTASVSHTDQRSEPSASVAAVPAVTGARLVTRLALIVTACTRHRHGQWC